jgi:hypothetical protein
MAAIDMRVTKEKENWGRAPEWRCPVAKEYHPNG